MENFFKILAVILSIIIIPAVFLCVPAAAQESFSWKEYDNGYVTFIYDDGRDVKAIGELFKKYNVPVCFSIVGKTVDKENPEKNYVLTSTLLDLQNHGCEILSHTYTHNAFGADTDEQTIEEEFSKSYNALTSAGFIVNGIIEAGNGGGEKEVNYELVEKSAQKYYKYSDRYGTSPQYKFVRTWLSKGLGSAKGEVSKAQRNKTWLALSGHSLNDLNLSELEELIKYITEEKKLKIVTVKYMYETFGNYSKAQDFGPTYYTVDYVNQNNEVIDSAVVKAGETAPAAPEAPSGFTWDKIVGEVSENVTVKAVAAEEPTADNAKENSASVKEGNKPQIIKWVIIILAAAAVIAAAAAVVILIIKKR